MIGLRTWRSCALSVALLATVNGQGDTHGVREFTESSTWRVPPGVTRITVELWGAGAGGGGGASASVGTGPGGGGGAGAYLRASLGVKEGETYTITIGAPGAGGHGEGRRTAETGGNGQDTVLVRDGETLLAAKGGLVVALRSSVT